jgi:hypothetical protein
MQNAEKRSKWHWSVSIGLAQGKRVNSSHPRFGSVHAGGAGVVFVVGQVASQNGSNLETSGPLSGGACSDVELPPHAVPAPQAMPTPTMACKSFDVVNPDLPSS